MINLNDLANYLKVFRRTRTLAIKLGEGNAIIDFENYVERDIKSNGKTYRTSR